MGKGYGSIINSFLSWGPFTVLGRLTFLSYLIHFEIIQIILGSYTYSLELNTFQIVIFYIGALVIVMSTAFVLTLCFEMPFGGLEKIVMGVLLGGGKKKGKGKEDPSGTGTQPNQQTSKESLPEACKNETSLQKTDQQTLQESLPNQPGPCEENNSLQKNNPAESFNAQSQPENNKLLLELEKSDIKGAGGTSTDTKDVQTPPPSFDEIMVADKSEK